MLIAFGNIHYLYEYIYFLLLELKFQTLPLELITEEEWVY